MKNSLLLLLIICLNFSACGEIPKFEDERCVISMKNNICRCHTYRVSKDQIGRISESKNHPVDYCENLIGFRPDKWAVFYTFLDALKRLVNREISAADPNAKN